jgi:hypothetical protein
MGTRDDTFGQKVVVIGIRRKTLKNLIILIKKQKKLTSLP